MAEPKNRRLVTEKRGFRVKLIKHPRYSYVVYRIADGRRVEQAYFQSERAANSHAYSENIRLKNEGLEGQILGPELRGQAIEATRRLAPYGESLRDAVDFYELHLKSQDSLRQIKLERFVNLVAEENEPRLQMELGHTTPKILIEHYRAIVTPANAQAWWRITPE
jgi:hypothetical protein